MIDLFHLSVFDRAAERHTVAIGHPRKLGPRDALEASLLIVNLVGDRVGVQTRVVRASAVLLGKDREPRSDVEQPHLDTHVVAGALHRAEDHRIGAELPPRRERHLLRRPRRRHAAIGVARDHVELALEVEIVPQHLPDGFGNVRGVGCEGDEVWNGVTRRRTRIAADHDRHFSWLLCLLSGRSYRRRCDHSCGRCRENAESPRRLLCAHDHR